MNYGKGGTTVTAPCTQGCGTVLTEFIPAGQSMVEVCQPCLTALAAAFWKVYKAVRECGALRGED